MLYYNGMLKIQDGHVNYIVKIKLSHTNFN